MNRTSKAAVFHGIDRGFNIESFDLEKATGKEILVEVLACTICGSDIHTLKGRRKEPTPSILGHEIIGRIAEFGDEAHRIDARGVVLQIGDRITWSLAASCNECFFCKRDLPQKCLQLLKYGHSVVQSGKDLLGGMSEYCWVKPGTTIVKLSDQLSDELACPANCATSTMMSAFEAANFHEGESILILGAGMLGLTAVAIARSRKAAQIACLDFLDPRLSMASELGANIICNPNLWKYPHPSEPYGWDVVIETSGATKAVELGMESVRQGGRLVLVGSVWPDVAMQLMPEQIVRKCLTIVGLHNYKPRHLVEAVEFLESPAAKGLEKLVSIWFDLDSISDAAQLSCESNEHIRIGLRP